jgi:Kef-type K+ transport system membrane component KefB
MLKRLGPLIWQFPLIVLACVVCSLAGAWIVSRVLGFDEMNAPVVATLSAVVSAAVIARELRTERKDSTRSAS